MELLLELFEFAVSAHLIRGNARDEHLPPGPSVIAPLSRRHVQQLHIDQRYSRHGSHLARC